MIMHEPYTDARLNILYNLLFCDNPAAASNVLDALPGLPAGGWKEPAAHKDALLTILQDKKAEARMRLLISGMLTKAGINTGTAEFLGVVVEVALGEGLDTVAGYADGTARYFNHSEKIIVWETANAASNELIGQLLAAGKNVVAQIGPWTEDRLPAPASGEIRLNFLTTNGYYFGQGPFVVLQHDPMGGPVIQAALELLQFLTAQEKAN